MKQSVSWGYGSFPWAGVELGLGVQGQRMRRDSKKEEQLQWLGHYLSNWLWFPQASATFAAGAPSRQGRWQPTALGYSLWLENNLEIVGAVKPGFTQHWANSWQEAGGGGRVLWLITLLGHLGQEDGMGISAKEPKKGNGEWAWQRLATTGPTIFGILEFLLSRQKTNQSGLFHKHTRSQTM